MNSILDHFPKPIEYPQTRIVLIFILFLNPGFLFTVFFFFFLVVTSEVKLIVETTMHQNIEIPYTEVDFS